MATPVKSPAALAEQIGKRLKQARLNADLTQLEVAERAGLSRKLIMNAEKGRVQLEYLIAILMVLGLDTQLDTFLPPQSISPLQLLKLQGGKRQRASGHRVSGHRTSGRRQSDDQGRQPEGQPTSW